MAQNQDQRPISPYMFGTLYRWQISSVTSSIHRITGVILFLGFALVCLWLIGAVAGGFWQGLADVFVNSWFGGLVFFICLFALWYHFLNGIRHLAWDFGLGFDLSTARLTGFAVMIGAVVLSLITLIAL